MICDSLLPLSKIHPLQNLASPGQGRHYSLVSTSRLLTTSRDLAKQARHAFACIRQPRSPLVTAHPCLI